MQLDQGCMHGCRYSSDQLPAEMIDNYKLPQLVRGWEAGMLRFLACRISGVPCTPHSMPLKPATPEAAPPAALPACSPDV